MKELAAAIIVLAVIIAATIMPSPQDDKACTGFGTCVIVAPTEDSCPAYTGQVEPIQGGGVVCFPG